MGDPITEDETKLPPEPEIDEPKNDVVDEPPAPETNPDAETPAGIEPQGD